MNDGGLFERTSLDTWKSVVLQMEKIVLVVLKSLVKRRENGNVNRRIHNKQKEKDDCYELSE